MSNITSPFGKQMVLGGVKSEKNMWNSQKIDTYLYNLENGIEQNVVSPYYDRKIGLRRGNINFKYTKDEEIELKKCMNDVLYFANKYAYAMTDDGIAKIILRDYQKTTIKEFQKNRYIIYLSSRQSGKCSFSTSSVYIKKDNKIKQVNIGNLLKSTIFYSRIKKILYNLLDKLNI